jgi:hypothetical protein
MPGPTSDKSSLMRALERHHKQPIEAIVRTAWEKSDTPEGAAARLGVTVPTAKAWRDRFCGTSEQPSAPAEACAA